jgi:error-prone DNA polymerase
VLDRQRPGKGNAIFVTLEDESGIVNILLWARLFEQYRRPVMASRLMEAHGKVQKSAEGVVHLMADRIVDRTPLLDRLGEDDMSPPRPHSSHAQHPRNVRIIPKSRDFH